MKPFSFDKSEEKIIIKSKEYVFKSNYNLNLISENKSNLKIIINGISILYLLYGRALYFKSLKGCDQCEFTCLNDLKLITDGIQNCLNSIGYFVFVLFLIHMNFCSFYILIILIIIYIELTIKDHDENFLHHGKLNLFALFSLTIMGEIIILFIVLYKNLFKNNKFFLLFLISSFFLIELIIILNNIKYDYYLKDWNKSLNNSYINNDPALYPCKINIHNNKCLINIFGPFLDFSKLLNIKCEKRTYNEKNILINNSNLKNKTEVKKIGYPIAIGNKEEINGEPILYSETLYEFVKNNLVDMDDKEQIGKLDENKKPEIIVDFSNSSFGKIEILYFA